MDFLCRMGYFGWAGCIGLLLLLAACGDEEAATTAVEEGAYVPLPDDLSAPNEPFYPLIPYLKGQIAYVDTTPLGIEKVEKLNGQTIDSGYISKAAFKRLVSPWAQDNPEAPDLKPYYRERSFFDQSIQRLTFSIEDTTQQQRLRQADIHLNPENNRVSMVVLRRAWAAGDSTVQQYILWEHNMNCQVSEQIEKVNGLGYSRVTRLVWDGPLE